MDCAEIGDHLSSFVDNELPPHVVVEVEAHLKTCAPCRRAAHGQAFVKKLVRTRFPRVPCPARVRQNILAAIGAPSADPAAVVEAAPAHRISRRQRIRRILLLSFMLLFPLTFNYYSPVLPIEGTFKRVITGSFLFWSAWALVSLFLGRSGCSYACPLGGLQELWDRAVGRRLVRVRYLSGLKYVLFAAWIGALGIVAVRAGGWERVDVFYNIANYISWDSAHGAIIYVSMFGLVLLFCLPLGKRAFCHYGCWFAPFNIIATKARNAVSLPSLHLQARAGSCESCGTCDRLCQMSQPVSDMVARGNMDRTECILCGTCVDNCTSGAIRYAWRRPGQGSSRA